MNIAKSMLDDLWSQWLAYMENLTKDIYDVDWAEEADDSWAIVDFVENFYFYLQGYLQGAGVIEDPDAEE